MDQHSIIFKTIQSLITSEDIQKTLDIVGYKDPARKFTITELLKFWVSSAIGKWSSYRESEEHMKVCKDLVSVDYSTLSKKASEVFGSDIHAACGQLYGAD